MTEYVKDRRANPRVETELDARVTAGAEGFEATVLNLSVSGVLLLSDRPLPEMTMVRMRLSLPPRTGEGIAYAFEIGGAVVRCEERDNDPPKYELAVFLTNLPREAKVALVEFVSARLRGPDSE